MIPCSHCYLYICSQCPFQPTSDVLETPQTPPYTLPDTPNNLVHDAYRRLTYDQLHLFCFVRSLSTNGSHVELACRLAHYDLHMYSFPSTGEEPPEVASKPHESSPPKLTRLPTSHMPRGRHPHVPPLPVEVMAEIMDHVGDWELTKAVGLPTSLSQPLSWTRASATDHALLTGYLPLLVSSDPTAHPPTSVGATLTIRFGYTHVLSYIFHHYRVLFRRMFRHDLIPVVATHNGRTAVLDWWNDLRKEHSSDLPLPSVRNIQDAIDGASRNGQVASLDWWLTSGLPFEYTEAALEFASSKNQLEVLDWWRAHRDRLPLKVGRVMDTASAAGHVGALAWWAASGLDYTYDKQALNHASCHGRVDVLQWWLASGLQLFFDQDALVGATRHDRPEVLDWWDKSGLPIQYRMCDVEEALEDAIGGGERAREWWKGKGVDFNANDKEWMKLQNLN
ncbi:hypothetical protein FA95DRAFT_1504093 [Auriscalpium vulgare]|uniref:Uncharacterized protein n=1 Tax=Auriscalpium vulgare TaxID=40419 RepID=A0ACB8R7D6_9AGAM|nr:hypothetical protein FA95DRAFT_1504093 [Auriscalpium vulgare]